MTSTQHIDKNLYLRTRKNGRSAYFFRYLRSSTGKPTEIGLGPADIVSRKDAKAKALEYRLMLHEGKDPLTEKTRVQSGATFDENGGVLS